MSASKPMIVRYFKHTPDLAVSLVMVVPLLLLYEIGVLLVGWNTLNGVDLFTIELMTHLGKTGFIVFNILCLAGFLIAVPKLKQKGKLEYSFFGPLLIESAVYALTMGSFIFFVLEHTGLLSTQMHSLSTAQGLVISAGAGVYEELVFRLALIPAVVTLWKFFPAIGGKIMATVMAVIISSVLFSVAHFMAEPWAWFPFIYRAIAGLIFAVLFLQRGFAVAVYTHCLYDVFILVFRMG
jgi:membrane protease YdiL (CAAX protease family)